MDYKMICVTGFGWSGSGAVFDLLREYEDIDILDDCGEDFEFTLIAAQDGLYDLDHYANIKHARISSSFATARFRNLIEFYAKRLGYERVFDNQFRKLSYAFLNEITDFHLNAWTWEDLKPLSGMHRIKFYHNNLVDHIFVNRFTKKIPGFKKIKKTLSFKLSHDMAISYCNPKFETAAKEYVRNLIEIKHPHTENPIAIDQIFPPDCPVLFFKYLDNPRCIIVRRDPRDTYLLAKCALTDFAVPLPVKNVDDFITFYKRVIESTRIDNDDRILSLQFEDLIYKYDEMIPVIEDFIGIKEHCRPLTKFDPAISINNTQLFTIYPEYESDIKKIEEALPDSLYPFEDHSFKRINDEVF